MADFIQAESKRICNVGLFVQTRNCVSKETLGGKTGSCVQKVVDKLFVCETPNEKYPLKEDHYGTKQEAAVYFICASIFAEKIQL